MAHLDHHVRQEYCRTRLRYRDSRQPTAVRVYSVATESRYLLVFGVPRINLHAEVRREMQRYGAVLEAVVCTEEVRGQLGADVQIEQFTDVFRVRFAKLESARRAKKFSDAKNFYGGILHISYAPELESCDDLQQKLQQRRREVEFRLRKNQADKRRAETANPVLAGKRKYDATLGQYVDVAGVEEGPRNKFRK